MPLKPPFTPSAPVAPAKRVARGVKASKNVATIDTPPSVAKLRVKYEAAVFYQPPSAEERKRFGNSSGPPSSQWGIKGTLSVEPDAFGAAALKVEASDAREVRRDFRMITVWERWAREKKAWTTGMFTVSPGTYAGYVQTMGKHKADATPFPSIWVIWEWDSAASTWKQNVPTAKSWSERRVSGVFIHTGAWPSFFLGCIGPGTIEAEWGVVDEENSRNAMWEILEIAGVDPAARKSRDVWVGIYESPRPENAKWFLIEVEAREDLLKEVEALRPPAT